MDLVVSQLTSSDLKQELNGYSGPRFLLTAIEPRWSIPTIIFKELRGLAFSFTLGFYNRACVFHFTHRLLGWGPGWLTQRRWRGCCGWSGCSPCMDWCRGVEGGSGTLPPLRGSAEARSEWCRRKSDRPPAPEACRDTHRHTGINRKWMTDVFQLKMKDN